MHPHDDILRYAEGTASETDRKKVDVHMQDCGDCREFMSFVRDFSDTAKDMALDEIAAEEPHPADSIIIACEEGTLDKETSLHLRAHMLFCDRCAETYYLLRRMRAPGLIETVIAVVERRIGKVKEYFLKPIEVIGSGQLIPAPVVTTKGSEEGQSKIQISQHVTDSGDEADLYYSLEPESGEPNPTFVLRIEINPPKNEWKAVFSDVDGKELASVPLSLESQIIFSHFPEGSFTAKVEKGDELLAECQMRIQRSEESQPE